MLNDNALPSRVRAAVRRIAGGGALLILAVGFWWWRIIAPAAVNGPIGSLCSDLYTQYIPVFARAVHEFRGGHFPQWNPDQLAGVPTLPSWLTFGVFYPLNVLFLILPPNVALGWTACVHIALAGGGMYWLASVLELSAPAARFAAVTYMLSRPLALEPNLFNSMALAPAVLASWMRLAKRPGRRTAAAAALLLALQFTTGGTQILVYTLYALALLLLFTPGSVRAGWRPAGFLGLAAVLAVGLVAALLLPTAASVQLSARATGQLSLADTLPYPTPTIRELGRDLLSPAPGVPRLFFGWTALATALLGIARPARQTPWPGVILITLVGTLLVLGPHTPAYALYYHLPTGNWFRCPQRAAMLVGIGIAVLAAQGVQHLQQRGWRSLSAVLVVLPIIELFHATWSWLPYPQARSVSAMAPPAAVEHIRSTLGFGRAYVALNWQDRFPFMEKLGTWQHLPIAQDYDTLTPAVYGDYVRALLGPDALVDSVFAGRYHPAFAGALARRALDMLAVKLIVIAPGAEINWMGMRDSAPPGPAPVLVANRSALPRAFVVHRVEAVSDEAQALRRLADPRFDPASTAVVISGEAMDRPPSGKDEPVEVVTMGTDVAVVRARLTRPGLLVLSDLMFPGWAARVDSTPASIFRTNGLFRGVYLDLGEHVVEFAYTPPRFVLGLGVTTASVGMLLMLLIWPSGGFARKWKNASMASPRARR